MPNDDFSALSNMKYSGRGIILGMTSEGNRFVGYSLTGRSPSSQARRLVNDNTDSLQAIVRTDVTDLEQLKKGNPALLIYPAIMEARGRIVASNGAQTRLLHAVANSSSMKDASAHEVIFNAMCNPVDEGGINITNYEPDAPNFTPRISGCLDENVGCLHAVKRKPNGVADSHFYSFSLEPKRAHIITTYKGGNENPLLAFEGEPMEARVESASAENICGAIYDAIGPKDGNNYRVAAAVMMKRGHDTEVFLMNRADRGE